MTMITPSYLGETIEYSSLHACRSTLEDPTSNTSDDGRFGICTRTGLCAARSGKNATQIAEMAVKQQPPDMSELLWS